LRSGDLWVVGSRQFKDFDGYLLPKPVYEAIRANGLPLPIEPDGPLYLGERVALIQAELKLVNGLAERGELPDATIKDGNLKITPWPKPCRTVRTRPTRGRWRKSSMPSIGGPCLRYGGKETLQSKATAFMHFHISA
jgi:hypothetical protein